MKGDRGDTSASLHVVVIWQWLGKITGMYSGEKQKYSFFKWN